MKIDNYRQDEPQIARSLEASFLKYILIIKRNFMEPITKDDLRQWAMVIMHDMEKILDEKLKGDGNDNQQEWLRSRKVRKMMDISAATLQNIRIKGQIRHKKIMGSYYYSRTDLLRLFTDQGKK